MMEILQTIWSSLTTENPTLTNIICIPLVFIEAYVSMLLFTTLLNINTTKKQKIIYIIVYLNNDTAQGTPSPHTRRSRHPIR